MVRFRRRKGALGRDLTTDQSAEVGEAFDHAGADGALLGEL